MPPPVFSQKRPQTIENKGCGREKERQESSRGGKRKEVKEIEEAAGLPPRPGLGRRLRRGRRAGLDESRDRKGAADGDGGRGGSGRGRGLGGCGATFTAHDSSRGTPGQLVEVTVEVQLAGISSCGRCGASCSRKTNSK